jgi:Ca-activated chloride channel homolog
VKCSCLLLMCLLAIVDVRAQGQPAVFRSSADLVPLNVVVTDASQKFVGGLSSGDFAVFEDGVAQDLTFFAADNVPLDLAILLDTSASMTDRMPIVRRAAREFVSTLGAGDRAMVVDVKERTRILYPLGSDIRGAHAAIDASQASGGTALYAALYLTFKELAKARRESGDEVRRQAVVVLSDGADTASLLSFDDVMDLARQSAIAAYTITIRRSEVGITGGRPLSSSEFSMKSLAQETGARAFFPTDISELNGVYGSIAKELASQYALAYTPKEARPDGGFRRIQVQVTHRPDVRTRTRAGYHAPRAAHRPLE